MLKMIVPALAIVFAGAPAFAQDYSFPTRGECQRNSAAPGCTAVQSPGTVSGPDYSTVSPGAGAGARVSGGGKGSGVTPQGNPSAAGGGQLTSQ